MSLDRTFPTGAAHRCTFGPLRAVAILLFLFSLPTSGAGIDLTGLSLEELMSIEVTSVSKKPERISETAAAVYVITRDDIRRSGALTIPDALRLAPGLFVAQIDANKWGVTSRGFSGDFPNKMLVMIDGRTVYTTLFSGVYWDIQDVVLEDVDRIEVVCGPGGTLWGSNAVNGVINIITRHARKTEGTYLEAGAGVEEQGFLSARHGRALGENGAWRVWAKYFDRDGSIGPEGEDLPDGWNAARGSFRFDWEGEGGSAFSAQGAAYKGESGVRYDFPTLRRPYMYRVEEMTDLSGGHLLARWSLPSGESSETAVQVYADHTERTDSFQRRRRNIYDADAQHRSHPTDRIEVVLGFGYRLTESTQDSTAQAWVDRELYDDFVHLPSAFVHSDIDLVPGKLRFSAGSKYEHHELVGHEFQPNGRILWKVRRDQALWAAVTRAVRTPSQVELHGNIHYATLPPGDESGGSPYPVMVLFKGDEEMKSEDLLAYEIGYRVRPTGRLSLQAAAFYNVYDHVRTVSPGSARFKGDPVWYAVQPLVAGNLQSGVTYGLELSLEWRLHDRVRLRTDYSNLEADMDLMNSDDVMTVGEAEGSSPRHQASFRVSSDLPGGLAADLHIRYVGELTEPVVDAYTELDAHLAWRPDPTWELSVTGRNLIHDDHLEYVSDLFVQEGRIERSIYGAVTVRF
ncbi:MAG: TonB-dependent receptor [Candidatus Eisenbacteria bacterium]